MLLNNDEIIANVAISKGLLTPDEINDLLEAGKEIPLHTFRGWEAAGKRDGVTYRIKRGEHGIETKLWKKKMTKKTDSDKENPAAGETKDEFYLAKAYLFWKDQVEEAVEDAL